MLLFSPCGAGHIAVRASGTVSGRRRALTAKQPIIHPPLAALVLLLVTDSFLRAKSKRRARTGTRPCVRAIADLAAGD